MPNARFSRACTRVLAYVATRGKDLIRTCVPDTRVPGEITSRILAHDAPGTPNIRRNRILRQRLRNEPRQLLSVPVARSSSRFNTVEYRGHDCTRSIIPHESHLYSWDRCVRAAPSLSYHRRRESRFYICKVNVVRYKRILHTSRIRAIPSQERRYDSCAIHRAQILGGEFVKAFRSIR